MGKNRKKVALRIHAFRRIKERHKESMPLLAVVQITAAIRDQGEAKYRGKVIFVDRQSNRVTRWHVWYQDKWYPVVYDRIRKELVTVLPEGAFGPAPDRPN